MKALVLACLVALLVVAHPANAFYIGVSPHVADLGVVERGKKYTIDFYPVTDHGKELLITLEKMITTEEFFSPNRPRVKYVFDPYEASEESVNEWMTFIENPVLLPANQRLFTLGDGNKVYANRRVSAIITIPEDAEPGYHAGSISFDPRISFQSSGAILNTLTTSVFRYVFKIEGDTAKEGTIDRIEAQRDPDKTTILAHFKNTGTVTTRVYLDELTLSSIDEAYSATQKSSELLAPSETKAVKGFFYDDISPGVYTAQATVTWVGGNDVKQFLIEIPEKPNRVALTGDVIQSPTQIVIWPYIFGALIIGILIYLFRRRTL